MMKSILLPVVVALMLVACVPQIITLEHRPLLAKRIASLIDINAWVIDGRMAIRHEGEGLSATIHWKQNDAEFEISLADPLGRTVANLKGNGERVSLKTAEGKLIEGVSPEDLQMHYLGWALPLGYLQQWVRGLPANDTPMLEASFDPIGRLTEFTQAGWKVNLKRYETSQLLSMPTLIIVEKNEFRAKLLVDERKDNP